MKTVLDHVNDIIKRKGLTRGSSVRALEYAAADLARRCPNLGGEAAWFIGQPPHGVSRRLVAAEVVIVSALYGYDDERLSEAA